MTDSINNNNYDDSVPRGTYQIRPETLNRSGRLIVSNAPAPRYSKASPQPFQQVMDNLQENRTATVDPSLQKTETTTPELAQAATTEAAVPMDRSAPQSRENVQRRSRDWESDADGKKSRTQASHSERPKSQEAEQRVVGRGPLSERGRDQKGQGQGKENSNSSRGDHLKAFVLPAHLKGLGKGKIQELGQSGFLQQLKQTQTADFSKKVHQPTVFSKALLDQIVHYVKLLSKADGEKEMDISLHEKVFKGLRLRVATNHSRIEATFLTESESVRELFLARKGEIEKALAEKGIDVRKIDVTMIQRG
ncbi:MAG: hypothetical protein HY539_02555 [Deltaproteobacteria bacterium]|nr:hypothetical protein [Deltaproteobacteria bacterium]